MRGLLIVYSGPSGVGKGTVREIIESDKELNIAFSVSMTTRAPRPGEVDGVDYFFVTKEEFDRAWKDGELIERAEFAGNHYGTPLNYVNKLREQGKNVLLEIEVLGAKQVINKIDDTLSIFLVPPSLEALEERLRGRATETDEMVELRLSRARVEMLESELYDHVVVNDNVDKTALEIKQIILSEMSR